MSELTPNSKEGFTALAHVIWEWHGPQSAKDTAAFAEECEHPDNRLMLNLYRGLSGAVGVPVI